MIKDLFKDETVFLVAGGPSLKGFDFELLRDKNTISINRSFEYVPNFDILYFSDSRFYRWNEEAINKMSAHKCSMRICKDVEYFKDTGRTGLELEYSKLRHGNNSGYAAINLAVHTGAKEIVLLGYDMSLNGTQTHFHEGYPQIQSRKDIYEERMIPHFQTLVEPLKELGINIYNTNKDSNLKCFPYMDIKHFL